MVVSIQDVYKVLLLNVQYIKQISTFLIKPKSCQLPVPGMRNSSGIYTRGSIGMPYHRKGHILFCKKNTLVLPKRSLKLISSTCSSFCLTTYFDIFGERVFQQTVGIPMCTNCASLLVDLFLYSYGADFIHDTGASQEKRKEISRILLISRSAI